MKNRLLLPAEAVFLVGTEKILGYLPSELQCLVRSWNMYGAFSDGLP